MVILFLILFTFVNAQILKISSMFLLENKEKGGLGLSNTDLDMINNWVGMIFLLLGGIIGGLAVAKKGLKYWLWPMLLAISLPDILYVYLSFFQPNEVWIVYICAAIETFGNGFGLTFILMYLVYIAQGDFKTSHYAIAAGFIALGMLIPGMMTGFIKDAVSYKIIFILIVVLTLPGFIIAKFIPLEYGFGKKKLTESN